MNFPKAVLLALFLMAVLAAMRHFAPAEPEKEFVFSPLLDDAAFLSDLRGEEKNNRKKIAIVAPGSGLHGDDIERFHVLADRAGFVVPEAAIKEEVPYNANSDAERLRLFLEALNDPEVDTLWAVRGGYGASRLLPELERATLPDTPKLFIGYSDMTFLHLFFLKKNWRTIHGGMFWELNNPNGDEENFRLLAALLAGKSGTMRYDGLQPFNREAREATSIQGTISGGNLTCLAAAVGTPWAPDTAGRILLLEDVREKGYKLDRMFVQLRQAGLLDRVEAIVLGTFIRGDEHTEFALERFAAECGKPVFRTDLFGHGRKNRPVLFNAPATIGKAPGDADGFILEIKSGEPSRDGNP